MKAQSNYNAPLYPTIVQQPHYPSDNVDVKPRTEAPRFDMHHVQHVPKGMTLLWAACPRY
jgi:hypothetical protein